VLPAYWKNQKEEIIRNEPNDNMNTYKSCIQNLIDRKDKKFGEKEISHYLENFDYLRYSPIESSALESLNMVTDIAFVQRTDLFLVSTRAGKLHLFNRITGELFSEISLGFSVSNLLLSEDVNCLIALSNKREVFKFNHSVSQGKITRNRMVLDTDYLTAALFDNNFLFLLSDRGLDIYDLNSTRPLISTIKSSSFSTFDANKVRPINPCNSSDKG
jgi:hypothetical protein